MKNHKEFDKYIKGLFEKDPEIPSELNWEAMDFDFPQTTEQNDKTNYKKYIGILLLLLFTTSIGYFYFNEMGIFTKTSSSLLSTDESIFSKSNFRDNVSSRLESKEPTNLQLNERPTQLVSELSTNESPTSNYTFEEKNKNKDKGIAQNTVTKINASTKKSVLQAELSTDKKTTPILNKQDDLASNNTVKGTNNSTSQTNNLLNVKQNKANLPKSYIGHTSTIGTNETSKAKTKTESNSIETSPVLSQTNLVQSSIANPLPRIQISNLPNTEISDLAIATPFPKAKNNVQKSKNKIKMSEVFIGYGYNTFNLNIDDTDILKDKVNNVRGSSLKAGIRLNKNTDWSVSLLLKYDQYHSTFDHIRALEPIVDFKNLRRIKREEVTFHNNYTNTIGLQIGLERNVKVLNLFQLYAGMNIAPTYTLSAKGKTTENTIVSDLIYDNDISKFALNGGVNLGVIYPINPSLNIELAYQYNRIFLDGIFINNDIITNQQNALFFTISYKLKK